MKDAKRQIEILEKKIDSLNKWSQNFAFEINSLRNEINLLKSSIVSEQDEPRITSEEIPKNAINIEPQIEQKTIPPKPTLNTQIPIPPRNIRNNYSEPLTSKINLEKFIGENLINKIGILITIIGIGIGASYAIEHNLINPLTRIILGYFSGILILGISYKLKPKYENFSAVLLGGGFSVLYFITFFAYSFYNMLPQWLAFLLMLVITGLTVFSSLKYDNQVIAHLGLVGAYTIPFLLSNDTGNVLILFSYMTFINIGILLISFKKYWKSLYYSSFIFTYLIYLFWYNADYNSAEHFMIAVSFISIFFSIFYTAFLAYKLKMNEKFAAFDLVLLFINSFIYYSLIRDIFDSDKFAKNFDGLITLGNAFLHFVIYMFVRKKANIDNKIVKFILGMVISFITIAIPVQFDGSWVTGLWIAEAVVLFWITSKYYDKIYEYFSYTLITFAFLSLLFDWDTNYRITEVHKLKESFMFLLNINFMNSLIFIIGLGIINYLKFKDEKIISETDNVIRTLISFSITGLLVIVIFISFGLEISLFWQKAYLDSAKTIYLSDGNIDQMHQNFNLMRFHDIWLINYSMVFLVILTFLNAKKFKMESLIKLNYFLNIVMYLIFVFSGTFILYMLSLSYLDNKPSDFYQHSIFNLLIKYISYAIFGVLNYATYQYFTETMSSNKLLKYFDILLYFSIFWTISFELVIWMNYFDSTHTFKLGLSILWGIYSSLLIALGIWKKKKHLRISAIVLFAITLLKLFFIDASHLATIPKTILFVTLGILLLTISFLYNKYKHLISDNSEEKID